ncbi:glucan biosynthesis protein [Acerihabitans sp. TG2]|uniref:glucan biosynthesis protein D n=1 Tax=Acerihabitans sp. TG2 TaxID=3096008 RepID=UPI002B227291|nr:glucan biosynthesis protein [Acerihabitans sp. TG2]MEA9391437.1 glucan biosynthesis protein [Acerihabitans sp. TG2]
MERRSFIKASLALAAYCGTPAMASLFMRSALAADNVADGSASAFDFSTLKTMAANLAGQPFGGPPAELPKTLADLTPQAYNDIQYDANHSLWHDVPGRQLDVHLFHVGMGFKRRVRMYSVDPQSHLAKEIHFRPELFNYHNAGVDTAQLQGRNNLGFAGFKVNKAPELTRRDVVSFLGASYFRAVDDTYQYGLSARGLAIDTYTDQREEFPDFVAFWFDKPKPADTTFTLYALLDSPSATGAYRFVISCEAQRVVMDIEKHIHARTAIKQLGITPITSMFSCGTNERRTCDTIHPQIHDSDRLAMWRGNGEWICRPLNNPQKLQFNSFVDENPKGFGLLQLNHNFDDYQDVIGWYNKRPSLWVEPIGDWGKGAVNLMEIPTTGETLDNIVCFWQPAEPIQAGGEYTYSYRLYWSGEPPVHSPLARIKATRTGMGGFPEGWAPGEHYPEKWARRFAIDFVGGDIIAAAPKGIEPVITTSHGKIDSIEILFVQPMNGYRVQFDWTPDSDSVVPVELRMFLRCQGQVLSETWLYQYFPPPPDKRQYVDDRQMS